MFSFKMFPFTLILVHLVPRLAITSLGHRALRSEPLPPDVSHIADDERTGNYLAYRDDETLYGILLGSSDQARTHHRCIKADVKAAEGMEGWEKIEEYAKEKWGEGYRIDTKPDNETEQEITICNNIYIEYQGGILCILHRRPRVP
ncbi:hypothetical protein BD779DRAFT_1678799 [Infundibulicybe gibba]|nr:hypothetical protein BD779DRAFT_1678799 [Infundibulicybe gibba]